MGGDAVGLEEGVHVAEGEGVPAVFFVGGLEG